MQRYLLGVLFAVAFACGAAASTYTDFNAGINAVKHENWDEAILRLTAALAAPDLNPAFRAPAYFDRAMAYWGKKQSDKALADVNASLQADPQYLDAYRLRLQFHVSLKQFDAALNDLAALIAARPTIVENYAQRGAVYMLQKNYAAALDDFTTVETLAPTESEGYALHGEVLRARGDYSGALKDFNLAVDHAPKNVAFLESRSQIHQSLGQYDDARDDLKAALDLSPNPDISMQIGIVDWKMGDYRAAQRTFKATAQTDSIKAEYVALWVFLSAGKANADTKSALDGVPPNMDHSKWPGPLIDVFAGRATPDAALKSAASDDKAVEKNQVCEANFYIGEFDILGKDTETGKTMLAKAAADCPQEYIERDAAAVDLKRMGGASP